MTYYKKNGVCESNRENMKYAINNSLTTKIMVGALVFFFVVGTFAPVAPYVFADELLTVSDQPSSDVVSPDSPSVDSQTVVESDNDVVASDVVNQEPSGSVDSGDSQDSASNIIVNNGDQDISVNSSFDTKISVDIFANGNENQLNLEQGEVFIIDWISANAVTCELFSDSQSLGIVVKNGSAGPFDSNHPNYPAPGTSKTFKIECVDLNNAKVGDSVIVTAPVGTPQLPDAPVLSATTGSTCGGYIDLSWNSVTSAQSYNVYRDGSLIASTSQLSFIDNVLPNNDFSYTVTALNNSGESTASNIVSARSSATCTHEGASADIFANGSQGPLVVSGEEIQLDWISANVVSCNLFSDNENLGSVPRNGSAAPIGVNHPLYPTVGSSKTYTISCVDLQNKIVADSVVVSRAEVPACTLPVITSDLSISGKIGIELNYIITASSTSEVTFSVSNLPDWLKFDSSTGSLTGTPNKSGIYKVEIYAQNECDKTAKVLTITIDSNGGGDQITVSLSADPTSINQGRSSTLTWSSTNATACSAPWTSATSTSGTQVVTPNTTTEYVITCTRNNNSAIATATVTVVNVPVCTLPAIVSPLSVTGKVGASFSYNFVATSTGTSTLILSVATTSLPVGLSYSTSTQTISGIPSQSGVFSVQLSAKDDCGETINNLTITIDSNGGGVGERITVSLSANPTSINQGQSSTLTWSSANATTCSAPWTIATSTSGTQSVAPNTTTEYAITCTNATVGASASTTITVNTPPVNASGGGSRSSGRGSSRPATPQVLGATASCDYLKDYLRIDWINDPVEVIKLQVFLKELEGFKDLKITGVFDQATYNAVGIFQERYKADILTPWGHDSATHFVYILTKKKVNEIVCNRAFPISSEQEREIVEFKAFLESLGSQGIRFEGGASEADIYKGQYKGQNTMKNDSILSENGMAFVDKGQISDANATTSGTSTSLAEINIKNIAAAIVAGPQGITESLNALIVFLVFLLAVYLIAQAITDRQNRNGELSHDAMRIRKMSFYSIGTFISVIICLVAGIYEIILPLIAFLIGLCFWTLWLIFRKKEIRSVVPVDNK